MQKKAGIQEVSSLTNALRLTPEMFSELVDVGMDWLTISVDGVGETYNKIRKPAKFDDLLEKLRQFKKIKAEKKSLKPVLKVQSVWPAISENPDEYFQTYSPFVDQVASNQLVDYLQKDEDISYQENFECPVLYQRLTIGADGRFLMCFNDEFDKHIFGDIHNGDTIYDVWHGKLMQEARKKHRERKALSFYHACSRCYLPRQHEDIEEIVVNNYNVKVNKLKNREQTVGM